MKNLFIIIFVMRFGIMGGIKSNFDIKHNKYIFFSSNIEDCKFYAYRSAEKSGGIPIILEIGTGGLNIYQVTYDFDYYVDHIDPDFIRRKINPILPNNKFGSAYSKFGYIGSVYPKWVKRILFRRYTNNENFDNYEADIYDDWVDGVDYQVLLDRIDWYEKIGIVVDDMKVNEKDFDIIKSEYEES